MQQASYNTARIQTTTKVLAIKAASGTNLLRWIGRKWDLVGVLALIGSSATYGAYALSQL